jgi:hypothetical protein
MTLCLISLMRLRAPVLIVLGTLATASCFPYPVREAPRITGKVVNARTGAPVGAALVAYEGVNQANVRTADDGSLVLPEVRRWEIVVLGTDHMPGRSLSASAPGFKPRHVFVDLGGSTEYVIALDPGAP